VNRPKHPAGHRVIDFLARLIGPETGALLKMGRIDVEVSRASLGSSNLNHMVGAGLGQIGGQVDVQAT
jgi:hypothetical protein